MDNSWTEKDEAALEAHQTAVMESYRERDEMERTRIDSVDEIPGENRITTYTGRWDYVTVTYKDGHQDRRYFHVDSPGYAG